MSTLKSFLRHPTGMIGLVILLAVVALAVSAPWLFPDDPWDMVGAPFQPPLTEGLWLGSDMLGRDVAAGIAHGARISLLIGVTSTLAALLIGVTIGATAGYFGGKVDEAMMRITELFQTIPGFILAILLVATLGPRLSNVILAIGIVSWRG
jgi:peptide/nickel transport system permease protein